MKRWLLSLTSDSPVAVGASRARGFHVPTYPYIPGGTLRGALAGAWLSRFGDPGDHDAIFERQVAYVLVGPATSTAATQVPLDRLVCKYRPLPACAGTALKDDVTRTDCPACGGPLEPSKGTWSGVRLERSTRTALDREETALEGNLYSREALSSHQTFQAEAWAEDLSWLEGIPAVRVGGRRTVGGRMAISVEQREPEPPNVSGTTLSVRCLAPTVLLDGYGTTSLKPSPMDLERALRAAPAPAARLVRSWTRPGTVGGWHAQGCLPKATEVCAVAGSVFEIDLGRAATPEDALAVERAGLGVRRGDGYGWVTTRPWSSRSLDVPSAAEEGYDGIMQVAQTVQDVQPDLVRRCLGWLRAGVTLRTVDGAAAFTDLTPTARAACQDVLAFNDPPIDDRRKRALIIALEVRS